MTGRSYRGIVQYFAAAQAPPALKAIVPEMALFEDYDSIYPGGILATGGAPQSRSMFTSAAPTTPQQH